YQVQTGRTLDEETFRRMASATDAWCHAHEFLFATPDEEALVPVEATRLAHAARRDSRQPFGRYEFAFDLPPERPIQLWSKAWEDAWNHPATVWLESVVDAAASPDGRLSWPRAVGTWVH